MSESGLSKVLDSIGRLKVGEVNRTLLAGLAIIEDRRRTMHPIERCIRWIGVTAVGAILVWWKGIFG
jgi:hypothetical protein